MIKLLKRIFKPEARNNWLFVLYTDGQIRGYAIDRIKATIYCKNYGLKGCLIKKKMTGTYKSYLINNHRFLN